MLILFGSSANLPHANPFGSTFWLNIVFLVSAGQIVVTAKDSNNADKKETEQFWYKNVSPSCFWYAKDVFSTHLAGAEEKGAHEREREISSDYE